MNHSLIYKLLIATVLAGVVLAFASTSTTTAQPVQPQQSVYTASAH
jgi:hypothetical protein